MEKGLGGIQETWVTQWGKKNSRRGQGEVERKGSTADVGSGLSVLLCEDGGGWRGGCRKGERKKKKTHL